MKKYIILLICFTLLLTGCTPKSEKTKKEEIKENPIVTMTIKDYGDITIELYPNEVYNTVANFVTLVEDGFYDNNEITRVQKGFVVQAGGSKELDYTIKGEFSSNGVSNSIKHEEGVISMARSSDPDSASGQFFIMLDTVSSLDGEYAAFGKVTEGMDIIHKIENTDFEYSDVDSMASMGFLKKGITIEKATVDTKGYTYTVDKITN